MIASGRAKVRVILLVALTCAPLLSLNASGSRAAAHGLYIALGDSIAAGVGSSLPRSRSYPALVGEWMELLNGGALPQENLAVSGETVATFIANGQLDRFRDLVSRALAAEIPIYAVSVSLGGNEMLDLQGAGVTDRQAGLETFTSSYAEALTSIREAAGPETPIVVTTYYDLSRGDATLRNTDAWWIARFNDAIRTTAERVDARIADVFPVFNGLITSYTHYPYDAHPTNAGHAAIAGVVWSALGFDTSAPVVEILSSTEASRRRPTLRLRATDDVSVDSVRVESDVAVLTEPIEVGRSEYVVLLDLTDISEPVAIAVEARDRAGNVTREQIVMTMTASFSKQGEP